MEGQKALITDFIYGNQAALYRLAFAYTRSREAALDIVQDTVTGPDPCRLPAERRGGQALGLPDSGQRKPGLSAPEQTVPVCRDAAGTAGGRRGYRGKARRLPGGGTPGPQTPDRRDAAFL